MKLFLDDAALQNHPLRLLREFLRRDAAYNQARQYEKMRFVGYVLDIGYDTVTLITSDPFKINVGGVPRNSLLIMVPADAEDLPPHFTLLRVLESAPTPLSKETQQTYFELQKKSMPELDVFTQSELQWGALKTGVLGMLYPHPEKDNAVEFSGDINNFVSAHKYMVYSPDADLLNLIVNATVPEEDNFVIGELRLTESRLTLPGNQISPVPVRVSTKDFVGTRTAMFGKTRLGKSNVVKLIAQSIIDTKKNVGQLIFDNNGEYANDNPQNRSLASVYPDRCVVYALTTKTATPSRILRLNFYEQPDACHKIIGNLLAEHGRSSGYIASFASVELPSIEYINELPSDGDGISKKFRAIRKLLIYWAILRKAEFQVDEKRLRDIAPSIPNSEKFSPGFNKALREAAYAHAKTSLPAQPGSLSTLVSELETINQFRVAHPDSPQLISQSSREPIFDADDRALLDFFDPQSGRSGTSLIQPFRKYHSHDAGDIVTEILGLLDAGKTVILDLGNADEQILKYYANLLSQAIFSHQLTKVQ